MAGDGEDPERRAGGESYAAGMVEILLCTADATLGVDMEALLAHWAKACCVRASLRRTAGVPPDTAEGALVFWDVDSLGDFPEELAPRKGLVAVSSDGKAAIRAYRWHPAAFWDPKLGYAALRQAMDRCFPLWMRGMEWLELSYKRDRARFPLLQLRYAEAEGKETVLHCADGLLRTSVLLGQLEQSLPNPPFFRCQKGFIVHLSAVESLDGNSLRMAEDGREIPVGRRQSGQLGRAWRRWSSFTDT